VIDDPAFGAGVMVSGSEPATRIVLGVDAQPSPQRRVRVLWSRRSGFVALGDAVLPGDAAGEPFADPSTPLEMTNGRPPALRA
jgi:hypothetical protein